MGFDKTKEKPVDIAEISEGMAASIKSEIGKFGFSPWQYQNFLHTVWAMKGDAVISFSKKEFEQYREKFIKKHEKSLSDAFVFEKYAMNKDFFIPRLFWDAVLRKH